MTEFRCVTVEEVIAATRKQPDKSCALDVLPTPQLKLVADLIAPFLGELFNCSLTTATVPEAFKFAYVTPRLKKQDPGCYSLLSGVRTLQRTAYDRLRTNDMNYSQNSAYRTAFVVRTTSGVNF